jgi:hypothetical protein
MKTTTKITLVIIVLLFVWFVANAVNNKEPQSESPTNNTTSTNPVFDPNKEPVIEPTYSNASADMIQVELPYPGAVTGKEFTIIGKARGYWFFEASFPVELRSMDGNILGGGVATAVGDWMTEDFVPFTAEMQTPSAFVGPAILILKKDNPSGDPARDASISFPITIEY